LNETLLKIGHFLGLEQAVVHKSTPRALSNHLFFTQFSSRLQQRPARSDEA
jgi:hypothetical protein